jgi:hypothetical protein
MQTAERTASSVLEHVFTHENPATGSKPPEHIAWVIFANGTAFYTAPTDALPATASIEAIEAAGKAALQELGPVIAGTSSADFDPVRLDAWFPGEYVYFVTFGHPAIASIVIAREEDDLAAGLAGRTQRQADLEALEVIEVSGFTGQIRREG